MTDVSAVLKNAKHLHFVGIGGSGMFPLVEVMRKEGYTITGSDVLEGSITDAERGMGIDVHIGHDARLVEGADAVVVTAALLAGNPEVARAKELGIPIIERAELLGYVSGMFNHSICISGTHGKTTTTSMVVSMLLLGGLDPSAVVGGKLPLIHGYGRHGESDYMVIEACEFKDTFLHLTPDYAVILDVDADHLDYFGTLEGVEHSFNRFAELAHTAVIANKDDANTVTALGGVDKPIIWFGEDESCDYIIHDIKREDHSFYSFKLKDKNGEIGSFKLNVPGRHNVHNGCAAAVCALMCGLDAEQIQAGFDSFKGAGRRFEILGEYGGITFADDYAHHPAELEVTINAAKEMGYERVIAVFQPFTYSRTKQHLDEFARVLSLADRIIMTEIMGSREVNTYNIYTADLAAKIPGSEWFNTFEEVCDRCLEIAKPGDLVITLGCGDIYKAAHMMVDRCRESNN